MPYEINYASIRAHDQSILAECQIRPHPRVRVHVRDCSKPHYRIFQSAVCHTWLLIPNKLVQPSQSSSPPATLNHSSAAFLSISATAPQRAQAGPRRCRRQCVLVLSGRSFKPPLTQRGGQISSFCHCDRSSILSVRPSSCSNSAFDSFSRRLLRI